MITGYTKFEFDEFSRKEIQSTINAYKNYKKWFKFPKGIKGNHLLISCFKFLFFQIMSGRTTSDM